MRDLGHLLHLEVTFAIRVEATTLQDFERVSGYSRTTIDARFGSWTALREFVGPNGRGVESVGFQELTDELWRLKRNSVAPAARRRA